MGPRLRDDLIRRARERARSSQTCRLVPWTPGEEAAPPPQGLLFPKGERTKTPRIDLTFLFFATVLRLRGNGIENHQIGRPGKTTAPAQVVVTTADAGAMFVSLTHPLKR